MICPKCGASKVNVGKYAYPTNDEVYRRRRCSECNHIFFTCEFPVDTTDEVLSYFYTEEAEPKASYRDIRNEKILEMFDNEIPVKSIAIQIGMSVNGVEYVLRKYGRSLRDRNSMTKERRDNNIRKLVDEGYTVKDIVNMYNLHESTVREIIKNVPKPRCLSRDRLHAAILNDVDSGMSIRGIAAKYNVSRKTVYDEIKRREKKNEQD